MREHRTFRPRLAVEDGRRVGKTSKAKRQAAQQATDAARLMRSPIRIREQAEEAVSWAERAEEVLKLAFIAAAGNDRVTARALAREALIEGSQAYRFRLIVAYCQMAEEGELCA